MVIIKVFNSSTYFTGKVIYDKNYVFYKNGDIHRYYGPAYSWSDKITFDFLGKEFGVYPNYKYKDFLKDVSRLWLYESI